MNDFLLRLRALFRRQRIEQELDDELAFHIEMQTRKNLAAGMPPAEAARAARIHFGASDSVVKDYCRDARRVSFIETLFSDIRYALRGFRRAPLFALTVVGTIAIGLGWNTAAFTIFNAYGLHPASVRDPYSLYRAGWSGRDGHGRAFTWSQYRELRRTHPGFSDVYSFTNVETRMEGRPAFAELVSGDYFQILGVGSTLGRTLLPEDSQSPGASPVIVLSYPAWKNQFGGAADIIGRTVSVRGHPFQVIGVAAEGFTGVLPQPMDFWAPITMAADLLDGLNLFDPAQPEAVGVVVRLEHGVTERQGIAALKAFAQRMTPAPGVTDAVAGATLVSEATRLGGIRPEILLDLSPIIIAFFLVLLSACANVANMMLARAMSRQREIGIRLSIGAPRSRLIRQLLTESVLLSLPAAALGFAISRLLLDGSLRLLFATVPSEFIEYFRVVPFSPDIRVFWFMMAAAVVSAILFGLAPALQATRLNVMQAARGDFSNDPRPSRLRSALVVAQVTICACLLISTAVLLRGATRAGNLDPGVRTRDVVIVQVRDKSLPRAIATLSAESGIELVAATSTPPMQMSLPLVSATGSRSAATVRVQHNHVSTSYFSLLDIPILRGRNFAPEEAGGDAPVAILSETAAARLWPHGDAIGQSVQLTPDAHPDPRSRLTGSESVRVIGIARDTVLGWSDTVAERTSMYLPTPLDAPHNFLLVRVQGETERARRDINAAMETADPGAIQGIHKMSVFVAGHVYPYRVGYWVALALGGIALLLTLSGIYGVLSYIVSQRTKEIGIRMAMGASTGSAVGLILRQCLWLATIGTAIGALLALGASQLLAANADVLIDPFDRPAFLAGIAFVLAACVVAAFFPARRAARVDPITTLRYD